MLPIRFPIAIFQTLITRAKKEDTSVPKLVVKLIESALKAGY